MKLIHLENHLGILLLYEWKPWKISQRRRPPQASCISCSLKHQKNPCIVKSPGVWQPAHLVWDSFSVISYTLFWPIWTSEGRSKDSWLILVVFKPQGSISLSEVSFKSAVELPQEQRPPFFLTCQFWRDHNARKNIGNSSEIHQQLSYKNRNWPD